MSLKYILDRVASEEGETSPELNIEQRERLLDIVNEAANEIYQSKDIPVCLKELYVRANSNKELALPPFIGEIRAIRSTQWNDKWELHDMRPRYQARDWLNMWKNWRLKGYSPIQTEILNSAPGTIEYPIADDELVVTLVGETENSNRWVERITMTSASMVWTKSFIDFKRIGKSKVTDYNLTIKDSAGVEISVIYADQKEARYVIIDISTYPNLSECPDGTYIMECLYKPRLSRLENDDDCFPVDGYDDVIVLKAKQLLAEMEPGKEQRAILMHEKSKILINQKVEDKTGTIQKRVKFSRNGMLGLFRKYGKGSYSYDEYGC